MIASILIILIIIIIMMMLFLSSSSRFPALKPSQKVYVRGFPGGAVVENPPANAGDTGSSPGLGRSHMPRSN